GLKHNYVGTEHLLLGLLSEGEGIAAKALNSQGIDVESARQQVIDIVGRGTFETEIMGFTPRTKRVFELSFMAARNLGHNYIGTEHLLLGLIEEGEGVAVIVLQRLGVDLGKLKKNLIEALNENYSKGSIGAYQNSSTTPNL